MDPLVRDRRLLLIGAALAAASLVVACGARQGGDPVGVSTAGRGAGARGGDAGVRADAGVPADFRTGFTRVNHARFVSNGHAAGRYEVDVYENPVAHGAQSGDGPCPNAGVRTCTPAEVPAGARYVEEHFERLADGGVAPGPLMMMEKREKGFDPVHGDFRYVVITASGDVALDGPSESCAGCHDDAPRDHVFVAP